MCNSEVFFYLFRFDCRFSFLFLCSIFCNAVGRRHDRVLLAPVASCSMFVCCIGVLHIQVHCCEKKHAVLATHAACYQQALRRYHSRRVHARCFEEGDLVLRCVQCAKGTNKLAPKRERPYLVVQVTRPGAVCLETEDGIQLQNSWNIDHLCKFYL